MMRIILLMKRQTTLGRKGFVANFTVELSRQFMCFISVSHQFCVIFKTYVANRAPQQIVFLVRKQFMSSQIAFSQKRSFAQITFVWSDFQMHRVDVSCQQIFSLEHVFALGKNAVFQCLPNFQTAVIDIVLLLMF